MKVCRVFWGNLTEKRHIYKVAWCGRSMNKELSVTLKNGNSYKFNTCEWLLAVLSKRAWALTAPERAERRRRRREVACAAVRLPVPASPDLPAPNTTRILHAECRTHILLRCFKI